MKMKRRIIAALMALCLCIGLLPATALAVDDVGPATDYITVANGGMSSDSGDVIITVVDSTTGQTLGRTTFQLDCLNNSFTITLTAKAASEYEIESVSYEGPYTSSQTATQWQIDNWTDTYGNEFTVTLCPEHEAPRLPEGEIGYGEQDDWTAVRYYRLYDEQILKMLRFKGVTVSPDTTIEGVTPTWVTSFGTPGTGSDKSFSTQNREHDYWELSVTTTIDNLSNVQPGNLRKLTITYDNGSGEQSVDIYSKDLRCVKGTEAGYDHHYVIELDDDSFHIVYFYNAEDANTTNFTLYAVEFVDHGQTLGENMPDPPTYASGTYYQFVNWEQNSWNGTGLPLLSTTVINEDIVAFARKTSTSTSGTQIEVSNEDNQLFDRVAELYNATVSDGGTTITGDSINKESVYIIATDADGDSTANANEDGWKLLDEDWYRIFATIGTDNVDISTIQSITVHFQANGLTGEQSVTIPVGENAGDMTKLLDQIGGNVLQLEVIPKPTAPDDKELTGDTGLLSEGTVTVDCVGKSDHAAQTDGLLSGTYSIGEVYWSGTSTEGAYYVDITSIAPDAYVTAYNTDVAPDHTLSPAGQESKTITLKWVDSNWTVDTDIPVIFTVTCDDEETPDPGEGTISLDVYVYLRVEGTGEDGALTSDEQELVSSWGLTHSEPKTYYILGKLSGVGLPEDILTDGELTYEKYATYIEQAFTDNKFTAHNDSEKVDDLLKQIDSWEKLSWAYGAPEYVGSDTLCLHLDGVLKLKSSYDLTYDANGGKINGEDTFDVNNITPLDPTNYELGKDTGYTAPTHVNVDDKTVLFAGWTLTDTGEKIYSVEDAKNGSVPAAVDAVDLTEHDTVYALWSYDADKDNTPDINEIIVTPADITIYTGGMGYGGVTDAEGNVIDEYEGSGLPKPGYHITLPAGLADELGLKDGIDLAKALSFSYSGTDELTGEAVTRAWDMTCAGVYSNTPLRYVYSLNADKVTDTEVRLLFKDAEGNVKDNDQINMSANAPSAKYTMTINPGGLDQKAIKAVFTVNGGQPVERSVFIDTGTLTIRSITDPDREVTTPIVANGESVTGSTIIAQAGNGVTYHVNESEVPVAAERVHLLVDEVSDNQEFNRALGEDAISEVRTDEVLNVSLTNPAYDLAYLDLVDTQNGNAVVTVDSGELTIHWPVPADAAEDSDFYVVHYHDGMDRETPVDQNAVANINNTVKAATQDGDCITFTTSTFSPFALVYEKTSTPTEQVTVTFKVVNGTWRNGSSQNIVYTINKGTTLASNSIAVPTGMQPESGYTGGSWDTTPNTTTTLNGNVTYTYRFTRSGGGEYNPKDATLRFNSRGGTEFDDIVRDDPFEYNPYNKIPSRPGYRFTGWYDSSRLDNRYDEDEEISVPMGITTVWAGWEETSVPSMLNGDDHYAYIQGYSDGTVRPNANITRAQVATIFFRLLDEDVRDDNLTSYNTFPDVDEDYWANTAISTMASLGVINGRNSGLFDPDAYITRAEFAAICARFDDSGVDGITTFTDTVGHWAEDEISRAAALGWIQGYSDGTFRPNQYITRAQAVTMINRVLCRLPEDTDDLLSGMNTWTDCHEDDWFYLAIQEATNSHDFVAKDRVYESWTDLNRAPDWSRYE